MPQFYRIVTEELPPQTVDRANVQYMQGLIIIKARDFVVIPEYYSEDYHICLTPPTTPPPLTINRKDCCYSRKSVILMPPDILISCKHQTPSKDYYHISLSKERFNDILARIAPQAKITKSLSFPYSTLLFSYAQSIYTELEMKALGYEMMAQSKLTEFIIQIIRESRVCENRERPAGKNYNYAERALEYIHAYFNANISLDDLCKELALSRYHFIRIFKTHTGTTPHAYLLNLRLQNALQLISNKDYPLEEIATQCGFVNKAHFSQCFKKKYGVTPSQYRSSQWV